LRNLFVPALATAVLIAGIRYASKEPNIEPNKTQLSMYLTDTALHVSAKNWNRYKEIYCSDEGVNCSWDTVTFVDWSRGGAGGVQSSHYGTPEFPKFVNLCYEIKERAIEKVKQ